MKGIFLALFLASFMFAFPATAFAQADVGEVLFVDILGVTAYPGAPFTGAIINDVVLFFFVPIALILAFVYITIGRFYHHKAIRLLLSVAFLLFIIFNRWFGFFIAASEIYFLFIIVVGIWLFVFSHIGIRREEEHGAPARAVRGAQRLERSGFFGRRGAQQFEEKQFEDELASVNQDIAENEAEISRLHHQGGKEASEAIASLRKHVTELKKEKIRLEHELNKLRRNMSYV